MADNAIAWFTWWLALAGFYLLLASKVAWPELVVGAAAASLAATAALAMRTAGKLRYQFRVRWLAKLASVGRQAFSDSVTVAAAIGWRLTGRSRGQGRFRTVVIEAGDDDPSAALRRALLIAGISVTPNSFLIAIDAATNRALVHQLVPSSGRLLGEVRQQR